MQTQDAPAEFLFKLWPWLEANKNRLIGVIAAVIVASGVYYFISSQREQKEIDAGRALTQLLVMPPSGANPGQVADSLAQFAVKFSGTAAAQRAQLQAAAALFGGGRYADAQVQFQKFLDTTSGGPLAAEAQLGVGASLEAQNKLDLAAAAYQKVASGFSGTPSALPALCALGRIAEQQGKLAEAENSYEAAARVGQAGGTLAHDADIRAAEIKAKLAAQKPATPVSK